MVDKVEAKHHRTFEVLYVATREGVLKKMSTLPGSRVVCLLEELQLVSPDLHQPITALKLLASQVNTVPQTCSNIQQCNIMGCPARLAQY